MVGSDHDTVWPVRETMTQAQFNAVVVQILDRLVRGPHSSLYAPAYKEIEALAAKLPVTD